MDKKVILKIKSLSKGFKVGNGKLQILEDLNLEIYEGEKVAIIGPSGSGKSTLLSILAGLDKCDTGSITVLDKNLEKLNSKELAEYRNKNISMIFQSFELISPFNVLENILTPLELRGLSKKDKNDAIFLLEELGLKDRINAFPSTLSGGEKQRVSIGRALIQNSNIILADEPTGSLDNKTGSIVLDLLTAEVSKRNKTLIIITHDLEIAKKMDKVFEIKNKTLILKNVQ